MAPTRGKPFPRVGARSTPLEKCQICEDWIYSTDDYTFFVEGYGHVECIQFIRLQAKMMRESG